MQIILLDKVVNLGNLGIAVSIVGPEHRFGIEERAEHETALNHAVEALERELRFSGEDLT